MPTFRKIVKDVAADYAVEEEGVIEAKDILTLANNERKAWEDKGGQVTNGATYARGNIVKERIGFMVNGPGVGERHEVVLTSFDEGVLL